MKTKNFPSSFPLGVALDSMEIWKKGEQFVVVMSPPKEPKGKKQAAPNATPWVVFDLRTKVYKEKEGMYTGECPALEVASQGDDEREARKNIQEAVTLFLEDCAEVGTLERVLLKRRFKEMHKQRQKEQSTTTRRSMGWSSFWRTTPHKKNGETLDHNETILGMVASLAHDTSREQWQGKRTSDKSILATS